MSGARCSLPDCHRGAAWRGLCVYHYTLARRQGRLADYPLARYTPAVVVPWTRPLGPLDRPQPPYCGRCGCTNGLHWAGCDHAPAANVCAVESQGQQKRNAPPVLGSSGRASLGQEPYEEVPHA